MNLTPINVFIAVLGCYTLVVIGIVSYGHYNPALSPERRDLTQVFPDLATVNSETIKSSPTDRYTIANVETGSDNPTFHFTNPSVALDIFNKLDQTGEGDHWHYKKGIRRRPWYGIIKNDNYCADVRSNFVNYPEAYFQDINVVITQFKGSFLRKDALLGVGNDIHPDVGDFMPKSAHKTPYVNLKPYVTNYFTKNPIYGTMRIGQQFSCLAQSSNRIPGRVALDQKDNVAENAIKYAKQFKDRPQCFNHDKFFPETWLLYDKADCQEFFNILNSEKYKKLVAERTIVYIRKVAAFSHRGAGVMPVTPDEEKNLRIKYDNGKKCGKVSANYIVQYYVHNPLLINGRKFDFRMYMLIASTNPMMAFYHDGFLRVSLASYDAKSTEKKVLLTNLALNQQIYDDAKGGKLYNGKDEEALKIDQQWSFDRLHAYLMESGKVTDPNWLDNYLRPEFKKAMTHLLRLSYEKFMVHSTLYELYGVDFMLDDNLNLWFIEANSSPALNGYSKPMGKFIAKMLQDHWSVVTALMRSRMKRVVLYINKMIADGEYSRTKMAKTTVFHLERHRAEFKKLITNRIEPEFELKADNGFSKFLDFNYEGAARYMGFVDAKCL